MQKLVTTFSWTLNPPLIKYAPERLNPKKDHYIPKYPLFLLFTIISIKQSKCYRAYSSYFKQGLLTKVPNIKKALLLVTICDSIKCKHYVANFSNFGQNQIIEHLLNYKLELHSFRDSQDIQSYSIFVFGNYL